jgi:23S rRNA (uracil1939-C5)-methyltransferase
LTSQALPGETVRARISKKAQKLSAEARVIETIAASAHQVEPMCSHFGECGGCALQNLDYAQQIAAKQRQTEDSLKRLGGFMEVPMAPIVPAADQLQFYRNKMEFSFSRWSLVKGK